MSFLAEAAVMSLVLMWTVVLTYLQSHCLRLQHGLGSIEIQLFCLEFLIVELDV